MSNHNFPELDNVIRRTDEGFQIVGRHLIPDKPMAQRELPIIRDDYLSARVAEETKVHNLRYGKGQEKEPKLLMAWLMLPTRCDQKCKGCYVGDDVRENNRRQSFYTLKKLDEILDDLYAFGVRTIGYAGLGELWYLSDPMSTFEYIDYVISKGFKMLIFTNGKVLRQPEIQWFKDKPVSFIISMRDTLESAHNEIVGVSGFQSTIFAINNLMEQGFHLDNRVGVEIPVIHSNEDRVLYDFIPAMRYLGLIPYVEMFMQVNTSREERKLGLNFNQARKFFKKAQDVEVKFGYHHNPCYAQRMVSQSECKRPVFSVTIYPDGRVTPCPGNSTVLGNLKKESIKQILLSENYKKWLREFKLCACSVFHTKNYFQIPLNLPEYLEDFR